VSFFFADLAWPAVAARWVRVANAGMTVKALAIAIAGINVLQARTESMLENPMKKDKN
jgi:hypothetical protein